MHRHTDFLSAPKTAQLIARTGLATCLRGLFDTLSEDFARWPDFEKSARVASHSPGGVIELMPTANARDYAFKYVNGHPGNTARGLPTVMAFGCLADVATGMPRFLCDLTLATALRTAATSALAAHHLARPDSRSMALIGAGSQAEFQALAFTSLLGIKELRVFDPDPAALAKLTANLLHAGLERAQILACTSASQAVQGADIVTTATAAKRHAEVIHDTDIAPSTHINAVGGDCPGKTELPLALLQRARLFVEFPPQTRIEGELQLLPADAAVTELWQVITGQAPGRSDAAQITLFDSVGFAIEDYSTLRYLHRLAGESGLLDKLALVPHLSDPRDLYRLLREARHAGEEIVDTL
ncbi:ornithine cyclodeaminase [Comamonas composti]|uniref:ornithine cyclodeaminase n=1 Tax=Comamonas composti TaxID=408558 RepID=UPI0004174D36|nr:ornithine cyclodeaminase [Comamonas composti]